MRTALRLEYETGRGCCGPDRDRFRLLALVPTLAGAVVALVNGDE